MVRVKFKTKTRIGFSANVRATVRVRIGAFGFVAIEFSEPNNMLV